MAGTSKNKRNSSANTRRSTKNTKNYRNTKSKKRGQEAEESFIRGEVMIIGSVALAILLFLSNFHLCGAVGDVLRGFMPVSYTHLHQILLQAGADGKLH